MTLQQQRPRPGRAGEQPGRPTARWVLFGVAVAVHLAVLYAPSAGGQPLLPHLDKVVHLVVFAAVALTGRVAGLRWRPLAVVLVLHAGLSEVLQGAVLPGRSADPWDAVADVAGVALGLLAASRLSGTVAHPDRGGG